MFNVYVSGLTVLVVFRFLVHLTLNGNNDGTKGGGSKEKKNGNLTRKIYIGGKVNGVVTCKRNVKNSFVFKKPYCLNLQGWIITP